MPSDEKDPLRPIKEAPREVYEIIQKVLKLERDWLYSNRPRVKEDVVNIVKEVIR